MSEERLTSPIPRKYIRSFEMFQMLDHILGRDRAFRLQERKRRKLYSDLHKDLKDRGVGKQFQVDRHKHLDAKTFEKQYFLPGIPVVFEGVAKDWPCCNNWNFEYFRQLHGTDKIVVSNQQRMEDPFETWTLSSIIDDIREGSGRYYRFYPLLRRHPEHIHDFDYQWLRTFRRRRAVFEAFQVFLGGDGTVTPLHNANQCNFFTQVHGEKEWILYDVKDSVVIDPAPVRNVYRHAPFKRRSGPFDPFNPDFETPYTLYQYLDSYRVMLKPGDVLWNPPFYWHAVKNIGESIGVGYRWLDLLSAFRMSKIYSFLDLLATNPPIWKSYKLYQEDVNLIHLAEHGQLDSYLRASHKQKADVS